MRIHSHGAGFWQQWAKVVGASRAVGGLHLIIGFHAFCLKNLINIWRFRGFGVTLHLKS